MLSWAIFTIFLFLFYNQKSLQFFRDFKKYFWILNICGRELKNRPSVPFFPHQNKPSTPESHHFPKDEWELPKEEFTLEEELGRGYFSHVHRGRWKNLIKVAVKILKSGILSRSSLQSWLNSLISVQGVMWHRRHRHLLLSSLAFYSFVCQTQMIRFHCGFDTFYM